MRVEIPSKQPDNPLQGVSTTVPGAGELDSSNGLTSSKEGQAKGRIVLRLATQQDREGIYRLRHAVYAHELGQHRPNNDGRLSDALDAFNVYVVAYDGDRIAGFASVTPPWGKSYSIDKYFKRDQLPVAFDQGLYEMRLLTVLPQYRRSLLSLALMYGAFRWAQADGGNHLVAIGRREVLSLYLKVGLKPVGFSTQSGAVTYDLLQATMADVYLALAREPMRKIFERVPLEFDWQIGVSFDPPARCYHGGDFFSSVGDEFGSLERLQTVISADVLDAWFPPAPAVIDKLNKFLPHIIKTSPPTECEGLVRAIARSRGVRPNCILPGAGSSDLIFLALRHWLTRDSRVLLIDPSYGEYAHVLEQVVGCNVSRLVLKRCDGYRLDLGLFERELSRNYDLVVLVNPNNPTGQHILREDMERVLSRAPASTRIWVDETYLDYVGVEKSLECFAAQSSNVIVSKSMSKVYALSGARAAYLCASAQQLETLRAITPPWAVSLPGQVAAIAALQETAYYSARYRETHQLRNQLAIQLQDLNWEVIPGVANFLLCHIPESQPEAATIVARCRKEDLYLRDVSAMGTQLGPRAIRVAVKDEATNQRITEILRRVLA